MANATFLALGNGRVLVADLEAVQAHWVDQIVARRQATVWLVPTGSSITRLSTAPPYKLSSTSPPPAVNGAIERLVDAGVPIKVSDRHRNLMWAAEDVLAALDAFAERADSRVRSV